MFNEEKVDNFANLFKAIGHHIRLKMVIGLSCKEYCNVSTMVENLGISQPNVSQHLNILKNARIIESFRDGNNICYKLTNKDIKSILKCIQTNCEDKK